jgi:hypothetical protein
VLRRALVAGSLCACSRLITQHTATHFYFFFLSSYSSVLRKAPKRFVQSSVTNQRFSCRQLVRPRTGAEAFPAAGTVPCGKHSHPKHCLFLYFFLSFLFHLKAAGGGRQHAQAHTIAPFCHPNLCLKYARRAATAPAPHLPHTRVCVCVCVCVCV